MKRYAIEFYNDTIRTARKWFYHNEDLEKAIRSAENLKAFYMRGLITEWEFMREVKNLGL